MGSEMCIRDSIPSGLPAVPAFGFNKGAIQEICASSGCNMAILGVLPLMSNPIMREKADPSGMKSGKQYPMNDRDISAERDHIRYLQGLRPSLFHFVFTKICEEFNFRGFSDPYRMTQEAVYHVLTWWYASIRRLFVLPDADVLRAGPYTTNMAFPRAQALCCLLYTSPSPRDGLLSRMPSSA